MSERLPRIEGRVLLRALRKAGFVEVRQRGSHVVLVKEAEHLQTTVPLHSGRVIPPGTMRSILRDIDMSISQLIDLL